MPVAVTAGTPTGRARHGARVVAVDGSAAMVAFAQKRIAGRARVIQADVSNLRSILADETFDLVLSSLVLHYHADLSTVFAQCERLLRPAGTLVFSTHHPVHYRVDTFHPGYLNAELIEEEWGWLGERCATAPKAAARSDQSPYRCRICCRTDVRANAKRGTKAERPEGI